MSSACFEALVTSRQISNEQIFARFTFPLLTANACYRRHRQFILRLIITLTTTKQKQQQQQQQQQTLKKNTNERARSGECNYINI
jgi:hypothetical protein